MGRAALRQHAVEQVQVLVEIKDWAARQRRGEGRQTRHALFTATHSMMSVYFGCMTIVLKLPFTSAASTKGLHKCSGFCVGSRGPPWKPDGLGDTGEGAFSFAGDGGPRGEPRPRELRLLR